MSPNPDSLIFAGMAEGSLGDFSSSKNLKVQAALALEARIEAARKLLGLTDGGPGADLTPEVRAELERLGYL